MSATYRPDPRPRVLVKANVGKAAGGLAAALALAIPVVAQWEGERRVGYLDIIGVPTYCFGGTGPEAVVGKHYTASECRTQLAQDAIDHAKPLQRCITRELPPEVFAAFISLSYNIGPAGVCRSSVVRYANAGDLASACASISKFNRAGGKVYRGLVNRRAAERRLCERGL
ncbi:MAG: lysozyme [Phycisphaerales bacterium]